MSEIVLVIEQIVSSMPLLLSDFVDFRVDSFAHGASDINPTSFIKAVLRLSNTRIEKRFVSMSPKEMKAIFFVTNC